MTNALREKRMTSLEISMSDLKELVAETSRQVAMSSERVDQSCEKADRDRILSEAKMDKFCQNADRERAAFREEMRQKYESFSKQSEAERVAFREEMRQKYAASSKESREFMEAFSKQSEAERAAFREEMRQKYEAFSKESEEFREAFGTEIRGIIQAADERYERHVADREKERREADERYERHAADREKERRESNELHKQRMAKMDEETRRHNLDMGRIANKQGTMVEDLVGPSIGRILRETLGVDEDTLCWEQIRVKRPYRGDKSRPREFDAIADCLDYALINETKSDLRPKDIDEFLETMSSVRDYFPEYADYKLIGSVAALHIEEGVVNYATKKGLLALAVGMELMDVQNPPGFQPKVW